MQILAEASRTQDYKMADDIIGGMEKFQLKYGSEVRPSDSKIDSEIMYNKYDIFKRLFYLYMLAGVLMLIFSIIQIFKSSKFLNYTVNAFHILIGFFFVLHTSATDGKDLKNRNINLLKSILVKEGFFKGVR